MPFDRDLDRRIAVAMGTLYTLDWKPTEDNEQAWSVVEWMLDPDGHLGTFDIRFGLEYSKAVDWVCDFTPGRGHPQAREYEHWVAWGMSPQQAICKAAMNTWETLHGYVP